MSDDSVVFGIIFCVAFFIIGLAVYGFFFGLLGLEVISGWFILALVIACCLSACCAGMAKEMS